MRVIEKDVLIRDIEIYLEYLKTDVFKEQFPPITDLTDDQQDKFVETMALGLRLFLLEVKNADPMYRPNHFAT